MYVGRSDSGARKDNSNSGKNGDKTDPYRCQWTVIAGDSNNRNAFQAWQNTEMKYMTKVGPKQRRAYRAERTPMLYSKCSNGHRCEIRWSDQEMVLLTSPSGPPQNNNNNENKSDAYAPPACHIVTSKFLIDQDFSLKRLTDNIANTTYCGSEFKPYATKKLPAAYQKPAMPDSIWFSGGFWALQGKPRTNCTARFPDVTKTLTGWRDKHNIRVVWQTLFPINSHESVSNKMIDWDYRCQKNQGSRFGLEVADIYSLIKPGMPSVMHDYHIVDGMLLTHQYMDRFLGGWETYLAPLLEQ